jgi:hypothetical protein
MTKYFINMTSLMLSAVIVVLLFLLFKEKTPDDKERTLRIIRDTIVKTVPAKPIVITKVKTRIIKLSDTIIRYHPFRAVVDTVIRRDTIRSQFEFPGGLFSLDIRRHPDTVLLPKTIIYKTRHEKEQWWEKPLMILGGVAAGFLIGSVK